MRSERVLIVGATGMLGAPVAQRLMQDGWRVRCLVRDPARARAQLGEAFEYVQADVARADTLDGAFEACDYLHLNLRGKNTVESYEVQEVQGVLNCASAAKRHGMRRITYLSGAGRMADATARHFPVRIKRAAEASLIASGVPWIALRATHFMESLELFVRDGRASVLGRQPHRLHYLAATDYARMVARALDCDAAQNRALYIFGPEALSMHEALRRYLACFYPHLRVGTLPLPIARLIALITHNQDLRFAAELFAAFAAIGEQGDPSEANRLLGAPTIDLEQWLQNARNAAQAPS